MEKILIDIGSSTVKVYKYSNGKLNLILQRSLYFKEGFDPEGGISPENKKELFELLETIKEENKNIPIRLYATGIFRKLAPETKINFIDEVFLRTGLYFNIIDQDLENFYLEMALVGKCNLNEPLLLINIGGGSTELVIMYGKEAIERVNLDFGVGKILTDFPQINEEFSEVRLEEVVSYVKNLLPPIQNEPKIAFYTGGELTYMKLANYPLKKNILFEDDDHPFLIELEDFKNKNREIFEKVTLKELENLMPENPKWMHGARPCSAIAQAICEKYNIEKIIPSDSNIINGIVRQEFRHVTLSGSFRKHLDYILEIKKKLEAGGGGSIEPKVYDS
jgi:exopolyphosphatase/pppGpp-phosphohydrolase